MKKTFLTILTVLAMVSMVAACKKDPKPNDKPNDNPNDEPTEVVTIDGNFADWAALKNVASAEPGEDAAYPGLLLMKAVADETNIYVYFEYELQDLGDMGIQAAAPFEIFVNSDNNTATGGASWLWSEVGYEYMLESEDGFLANATTVRDMGEDIGLFLFDGVDGVDAWGDGGHLTKQEVTAFCESAGTVKNNIATVEVSFLRSVVNATKKGTVAIGLAAYDLSDPNWHTSGVLPLGVSAGEVGLLEVTLP